MAWILFTALAALSWGMYGPVLHQGRMGLGGSAMRAFLCVGVAYFLIAIVVPIVTMMINKEPFEFTTRGATFSTLAGVAGAVGAVAVIFAFASGGKPIYVMPLVFGAAPIVNAIASMAFHKPTTSISPLFWVGIAMAGGGAYMVLTFKPS